LLELSKKTSLQVSALPTKERDTIFEESFEELCKKFHSDSSEIENRRRGELVYVTWYDKITKPTRKKRRLTN